MPHSSASVRSPQIAGEPILDISAMPPDTLLTRRQVAAITGFKNSTLRTWASKDRGPKVTTVEGNPRFRVADVRQWMGLVA